MTSFTPYHAKYSAYEITRRCPPDSEDRLAGALVDAQVDLNPHQIDAALFAFHSPLSLGVPLADEVSLGKTIEAGLVLAQRWAERKRRLLVITPSNLRKQWHQYDLVIDYSHHPGRVSIVAPLVGRQGLLRVDCLSVETLGQTEDQLVVGGVMNDGQAVDRDVAARMLSIGGRVEALCKLEGFTYAPSESVFWQHGHSTERDFIYVTTHHLTHEQLAQISDDVGPERTLLVMCTSFRARADAFPNLTVRKIPKTVLSRCEWGRDDYSLEVASLAPAPPSGGQQGLEFEE